ncbi:MAG: DUF6537 domain-containing protein, partial [Phenylobacterium sp.]|nr:DUF6537 domain-containing protein [Phenylobacterium sp.]
GAENPHGVRLPALSADSTPLPTFEASPGVRNIVFTGVGGTGVTTTASILAMAAHVDGKAASVVDMTGLAQKGGAVFSHVRIGEDEESIVGGRTPAASAHVLIACDVMVAAGADALALYAKDRTVAFGNADLSPTADFVTDRDVRFDSSGMARRIAAAARSYDETPAHHMAESELGDAIYANMIMLGFAWQKGVIPISSRALYRAIRLNGVAAEQNLQAFEMGRRAAHDPESRGRREADVATPETLPLAELIAHRTRELAAYQNAAYARRYQDRVEAIGRLEGASGSEALTRAVAINLYKLMAYKDEYEVARLYADGRFDAYRSQSFQGGKAKVWLAPPILGAKDDQGHPRKIAFGGWMLDYGFPVLARLKGLRGTALDLFGYSLERQMERALIVTYEADLQRIARELTPERLALAVELAQVPQDIRGFGHVKQASLGPAMAKREALWAKWDDGVASAEV